MTIEVDNPEPARFSCVHRNAESLDSALPSP